jgi:murein DD-endopeptidase MepM/ murein hydrolase activator NlpD
VSSQPRLRLARRAMIADLDPAERRGWLSHGVAALAISALGLAVAGSLALTTNAEVTSGSTTAHQAVRTTGTPSQPATTPTTTQANPRKQPASLRAFTPAASAPEPSRSAQLRTAIVKERAAQRAETLAKTAEDVSRSVRDQASSAREANLKATDLAIRESAVQLAWARQQRAIAARVAAEGARADAETAASTTPDLSNIPTGGGGVSPVPGAVIGARFGEYGSWSRYHTGLDFRAAYGTPIRAVKAGVVLYAGNSGDWAGNHVAIRHADGMTTMSSHMSAMAVHAGQTVQAGQVIGYVGETGRAFGAHLHFELYPVGVKYGDVYKAINPQPWLLANGVQTH